VLAATTSAASPDPHAPAVALGGGWGVLESFNGATFRWEGEDAQILVRGTGLAAVTVDAEGGPGIGRPSFVLRALAPDGRQTDAAEFHGRSTAVFFLPAEPGGVAYRMHADGADRRVANPARVLDYRVFSVSSGRGELLFPEIAAAPVRIDGGWYGLEYYPGEVFRWVDDDARFSVTAPAARNATLRFVVEPGPALAGAPLALTVTQGGHAVRMLRLERRTIVSLPVRLSTASNQFALRTHAGTARTPGDPRTLDFRVLSLQVR